MRNRFVIIVCVALALEVNIELVCCPWNIVFHDGQIRWCHVAIKEVSLFIPIEKHT